MDDERGGIERRRERRRDARLQLKVARRTPEQERCSRLGVGAAGIGEEVGARLRP